MQTFNIFNNTNETITLVINNEDIEIKPQTFAEIVMPSIYEYRFNGDDFYVNASLDCDSYGARYKGESRETKEGADIEIYVKEFDFDPSEIKSKRYWQVKKIGENHYNVFGEYYYGDEIDLYIKDGKFSGKGSRKLDAEAKEEILKECH